MTAAWSLSLPYDYSMDFASACTLCFVASWVPGLEQTYAVYIPYAGPSMLYAHLGKARAAAYSLKALSL